MAKTKPNANAGRRPARAARSRAEASTAATSARRTPAAAAQSAPTKQAVVIGLLQREGGATLADLVAATGWLPHTTRAALTRLRQAGHVLDKSKGEAGAVYRIVPARAARSRKAA